jgi:hypothetical protein
MELLLPEGEVLEELRWVAWDFSALFEKLWACLETLTDCLD